ncbi:DinB family protein (plasmid) [Gemmatirosa kalamazoonensis]|jgi:uncharacterized damage-inducible protein DinB|uniref:DinB family protein n=1 Tax=Gemmatirosa kalamazoonensis TaxID=861299 RepID=W0RSS9_9BACT|nr:DinB family protein [Gemmatirosa kalamazoonensis]AHG93370.1 DinB family protein [Gemmatirosa kalamazoonensis]
MSDGPAAAIAFRELIHYTNDETARWHRWLAANPGALDLAWGDARIPTVRHLVQHIFAIERRSADRLHGDAPSPLDVVRMDDVDSLFASGREAREKLERYLASATDEALTGRLEFTTASGDRASASRRKIVAHVLLHGIRHWAQLAAELRRQGRSTDGRHDIAFSDAME